MRLFTAISLPNDVRKHLARLLEYLRSADWEIDGPVRWAKIDNLHLTLKFLGEVADDAIPRVLDALGGVHVAPVQLFADHLTAFPKRGRAHVIAVALGGAVIGVNALFDQIDFRCAASGIAPRDRRAYTPHVTLGRSRDGARCSFSGKMLPGPPFVAESFGLFESTLSSTGAEYRQLAEFGVTKN
jgi:2'-5' RNA ligase